jgi:hypothetical protein
MILTDQEAAYVRRFCFEVWHRIDGPDTTINQCSGHYYDLAALATLSGIQYEVIQAAEESGDQEPPPPVVPFPWDSVDALQDRVKELQHTSLVHDKDGAGVACAIDREPVSGARAKE